MKPQRGDPPLTTVDLSRCTTGKLPIAVMIICNDYVLFLILGSLHTLVEDTNYFGFPCVLSHDSQLLAGFLTRKDIMTSLGYSRCAVSIIHAILIDLIEARRDEGITLESKVFFLDSAHRLSQAAINNDIPSVNIRGIMDPVSVAACELAIRWGKGQCTC